MSPSPVSGVFQAFLGLDKHRTHLFLRHVPYFLLYALLEQSQS